MFTPVFSMLPETALSLYHAHFFIINITILKKQTEKWVELGLVVNLCEEIWANWPLLIFVDGSQWELKRGGEVPPHVKQAPPWIPSPTPYPSTPLPLHVIPSIPPPPQFAFLPPNLALTAVHAFSFHLDSKKWERFFMNSLPTSGHYWSFLVQSSSTALYFQVLWLIDEQPDEKRKKQQFSGSESWPLLPLFFILWTSRKILVPHLYLIGFW